eukprot:TRINITY_DN103057_c0_g1_i1.p1 TRINITY_DN103057_c0_g1~~TRINITY_DN103057_c0_g1_i1.p1  ORF type:complete len:614 (+),score=57.23 TRINITY_DN103057_c0_g1_i1:97-1938(+)
MTTYHDSNFGQQQAAAATRTTSRRKYKRQVKTRAVPLADPIDERWGSFCCTVVENCVGLRGFYQLVIKKPALLRELQEAFGSRKKEETLFTLIQTNLCHISENKLNWGEHMKIDNSLFVFRLQLPSEGTEVHHTLTNTGLLTGWCFTPNALPSSHAWANNTAPMPTAPSSSTSNNNLNEPTTEQHLHTTTNLHTPTTHHGHPTSSTHQTIVPSPVVSHNAPPPPKDSSPRSTSSHSRTEFSYNSAMQHSSKGPLTPNTTDNQPNVNTPMTATSVPITDTPSSRLYQQRSVAGSTTGSTYSNNNARNTPPATQHVVVDTTTTTSNDNRHLEERHTATSHSQSTSKSAMGMSSPPSLHDSNNLSIPPSQHQTRNSSPHTQNTTSSPSAHQNDTSRSTPGGGVSSASPSSSTRPPFVPPITNLPPPTTAPLNSAPSGASHSLFQQPVDHTSGSASARKPSIQSTNSAFKQVKPIIGRSGIIIPGGGRLGNAALAGDFDLGVGDKQSVHSSSGSPHSPPRTLAVHQVSSGDHGLQRGSPSSGRLASSGSTGRIGSSNSVIRGSGMASKGSAALRSRTAPTHQYAPTRNIEHHHSKDDYTSPGGHSKFHSNAYPYSMQ